MQKVHAMPMLAWACPQMAAWPSKLGHGTRAHIAKGFRNRNYILRGKICAPRAHVSRSAAKRVWLRPQAT
jgi:hypothetical protein